MKQFVTQYKLPILFITAFFMRLINLNQSLWLDEATTAITVKTHSFIHIITQFSPTDFHPPLYYLVVDVWTNLFGYSEIALRMPSVLFSLGTGWVIYNIITNYELRIVSHELRITNCELRITNCELRVSKEEIREKRYERIAFWAAAFFLFNPLIIYYSQEARMYSMVTFFVAVSFSYLIKFLTSTTKRLTTNFWLMNAFLMLSFFTFYASIFYIVTVYVYLFWTQPRKGRIFIGALVTALGMALITPLLIQQYLHSRAALVSVSNWSLVLGKVTLKNLFLIPIKFTSGRISFYPKILYYVFAGGWTALVASPIILNLRSNFKGLIYDVKLKRFRNTFGMILFFLITPLILGALFSLNSPLFQYFRFQYLIIFMSVGLSLCVGSILFFSNVITQRGSRHSFKKKRFLSTTIYCVLLIGFISWSLLYLLFPPFHREDWKTLATDLQHITS